MSQISARENAGSHAARDHWVAERVFDWSGIAVTHLRPTFFAEWLLYNAAMIRAGTLASPLGSGKHAPVPAEDQARVIVGILENPAPHRGKVYPLFGPKEYTQVEVAQVLSRLLGKDIRYRQVAAKDLPRWQRRGPFFLQHIGEVALDHQAGLFAGTNDVIETVGGRPPMSLEAFIKKHHNAFA